MMGTFDSKVVVVTGGANGIGRCICEEFARAGAKVCLIDMQENPYFVGNIGDKETLERFAARIEEAQTILVFSCGVGVQTVAEMFPGKRVCAACDTYALPGFQGVTPLEYDCKQCGECYLNLTGGICPITACSKSLLNGQCGGAKDGKCEVDPNMECGWERIMRRLAQVGRLDAVKCPVQVRNYATDDEVKK